MSKTGAGRSGSCDSRSSSWSTRTADGSGFSPTTSGYAEAPSTGGASGCVIGSSSSGMRTRSTERRAATAVFCAARAEWRTSAPSDAPETSRAPVTTRKKPRTAVPVSPRRRPKMRSSASPVLPPRDSPRMVMTPRPRMTRPVRNGLTSISWARATRRPPTASRTSGTPMRPAPTRASRAESIRSPA